MGCGCWWGFLCSLWRWSLLVCGGGTSPHAGGGGGCYSPELKWSLLVCGGVESAHLLDIGPQSGGLQLEHLRHNARFAGWSVNGKQCVSSIEHLCYLVFSKKSTHSKSPSERFSFCKSVFPVISMETQGSIVGVWNILAHWNKTRHDTEKLQFWHHCLYTV